MNKRLLPALCLLLLPISAWAHPGHDAGGFISGLTHPFSGLDHILGMLAVGVWSARNQGISRCYVPAAFLGGMAAGGMLGFEGIWPGVLESAVAASVLAVTLMVALAVRLPLVAQLALAMFFALWHGIAHGVELPAAASPWSYGCGFAAATALLLCIGLALGHRLGARDRWLGAGMSMIAATLFWA